MLSASPEHPLGLIRRNGSFSLTFLVWAWIVSFSGAAPGPSLHQRKDRADKLEERGAWLEACKVYEDILRSDRNNDLARDGYRRCLRRLHQSVRQEDATYRQVVQRLQPPHALDAYEQILTVLTSAYPDRTRTGYTQLFYQGLLELKYALDDPQFRRQYLAGVKPAAIEAFKARLATWSLKRIHSRGEARDQVLAVVRTAPRDGLPIRPALVSAMILEFAAGACNTLDEYSSFLSPGHLATVQDAIRGKLVGVGLEVTIENDHCLISRVHAKSPADEAYLQPGDRVLSIGGEAVVKWPVHVVAEKLLGTVGSAVEIEVEVTRRDEGTDIDETSRQLIKLVRRPVQITSVESLVHTLNDGSPAGYIKIHHFQESTPQEVKEALAAMTSSMGESVRGLILDLRGNPGGLFKAAVTVAELFVTGGVIVIGQSSLKEFNRPFKAETIGPYQLPIVVLIDGETASAAEVLAGALKDARPTSTTLLMGQTTFGKGSVQCLIPVEKTSLDRLAGIRLTVAKLFSPTNQPYNGRGVSPHEFCADKGDDILVKAREALLKLLKLDPTMRPMGMGPGMS